MKSVRLANYEKNGKAIYTEEGIPTEIDELNGYEELEQTLTNLEDNKQDKTDNSLQTTDKTVVGSINELQSTKQDNLTQTQLDAVNSGITSEKVEQIETNRQNIEQLSFQYLTITLNASDWSSNTQTKTISTITGNSMIWVSATPASIVDYTNAGIIATAQGNGTLTFTCNQTPSADIEVNLIINNSGNTGVIQENGNLYIFTTSDTITQDGEDLYIGGNN